MANGHLSSANLLEVKEASCRTGAAFALLVAAIRDEACLDDEAFTALLLDQPDTAARKRLTCGLHRLGLVTCEQHVAALIRFVFKAGEAA